MPELSKKDKLRLLTLMLESRHADLREQNLNRQGKGDFFEAVCFAKERKLPVLFIVEDNAYGISTPTREINPLALGVLEPDEWQQLAGEDVQGIHGAAANAMDKMRAGGGPQFWWIRMERLSSHTSSDDQKLYRSAE